VSGIYLEGASWDVSKRLLIDPIKVPLFISLELIVYSDASDPVHPNPQR
jgi:hypothetical protein